MLATPLSNDIKNKLLSIIVLDDQLDDVVIWNPSPTDGHHNLILCVDYYRAHSS